MIEGAGGDDAAKPLFYVFEHPSCTKVVPADFPLSENCLKMPQSGPLKKVILSSFCPLNKYDL